MQVAACLSRTVVAEGEDELRCDERLASLQPVVGRIRVYSRYDAQSAHVVHLERTAEVARPSYRSEQCPSGVLLRRRAYAQLEERLHEHRRARSQLGVDGFLSERELLCGRLRLACPFAVIVGEIVCRLVEVEHGARISPQRDVRLLPVLYLAPRLDDVLPCVGGVVEGHLKRVFPVGKTYHRLRASVDGACLRVLIIKIGGHVSVGMRHRQSRLEEVLSARSHVRLVSPLAHAAVCSGVHAPSEP